MASGLILSSGSPVIGSPLTVQVSSSALVGDLSFHRIKLIVVAALLDPINEQGDSDYTEIEMSAPVSTAESTVETVEIDISSALRAVAEKYVHKPMPPMSGNSPAPYPTVKWRLEAYDEYMTNGNVSTTSRIYYPAQDEYYKSLFGSFSEMERLRASATGFRAVQLFSRKPATSPEIVAVGETVVIPKPFAEEVSLNEVSEGPTSVLQTILATGLQNFGFVDANNSVPMLRHQMYAVPQDTSGNRYQLRFVNGMGCLESFSCKCLRSGSLARTTTNYRRALQEQFSRPSSSIVRHTDEAETWAMSTGPLDEAWIAWFSQEVLGSSSVWILVDGQWLHCLLSADDKIALADRTKSDLSEIKFNLRFDYQGTIHSALLI